MRLRKSNGATSGTINTVSERDIIFEANGYGCWRRSLHSCRQLRMLAIQQAGYISGETLRSIEDPELFLVIST
jgi:hypothetical protein